MMDETKSQGRGVKNEGENGAKQGEKADIEKNNAIAALSYIFILFLVPLLGKRNSRFAQFHAKQGLALFAVELLAFIFIWVPFFGQLAMLALLIISVMGVVKALSGEWWEIPYVYEWSKKIHLG